MNFLALQSQIEHARMMLLYAVQPVGVALKQVFPTEADRIYFVGEALDAQYFGDQDAIRVTMPCFVQKLDSDRFWPATKISLFVPANLVREGSVEDFVQYFKTAPWSSLNGTDYGREPEDLTALYEQELQQQIAQEAVNGSDVIYLDSYRQERLAPTG